MSQQIRLSNVYTLKVLTPEDDIQALGMRSAQAGPFQMMKVNPDKVKVMIDSYKQGDKTKQIAVILWHNEEPVGIIAAYRVEHPFFDDPVVSELIWYVDEAHRGRHSVKLLEALETWSREVAKVKYLCISGYEDNDKVKVLYKRRGYTVKEYTCMKELV